MAQSDDTMCPICKEVFLNPMICEDGFSYEKSYIEKWLVKHKLSPMIGIKLENTTLRENYALRAYTSIYKGLTYRLTNRKLKINGPNKEQSLMPKIKKKFDTVIEHYYKSTLELEECSKKIAEIYEEAPKNFEVIMNYANILRYSTKFDIALGLLKTLKDIRPGTFVHKYMKIRILAESGNKDNAILHLKNLATKYMIQDHLLLEMRFMSYSLLSTGNRDHAYTIINSYIKIVPSDKRAVSHSIYINLIKENFKSVIIESEKYLNDSPDDISILFHLAKAYGRTEKKSKSIEIYAQIKELTRDKSVKAKALYDSATSRNYSNDFDMIVKELEESHSLDPKEEADGYLAAIYADKKMYDKAEEWLNICGKRIDIMNDKMHLGIKAQIEEHKKLYEKAIESYIKLAEIDSINSIHYNNKVDQLFQKQATEESENTDGGQGNP